jgi:DNA-binding HxlR family transcriptional regulator
MSTLTLDELVALGKYRWAVPLLADLAAHKGGRFVELLHRLKIARESLTRTLEGCMATGWVIHNPGHGHPLRPEYILTEVGQRIAAASMQIEVAHRHIGPVMLTRWSLPIIHRIDRGAHRFNAIGQGIAAANPRGLTLSLKSLVGQSLVARTVVEDYPPVPEYALTEGGLHLARAIAA